MTLVNVVELLSACADAAEKVATIIQDVQKSKELNVQYKGVDDPMTQADIDAQQMIVSGLQNRWQNLVIIGEEECPLITTDFMPKIDRFAEMTVPTALQSVDTSRIVVWIDPLDGTQEYIAGRLGSVTTLIGISVDGVAVAGVVSRPFVFHENGKIKLYTACEGLGAFGLESAQRPEGRLCVVSSLNHHNEQVEAGNKKIGATEILRKGGAGNKTILVGEGDAEAYVYARAGTKKWDTCAPAAVLRALGGDIVAPDGTALKYDANAEVMNSKGLIACADMKLLEELVRRFNA